jgi:3'(2'), 5'-bisphosphate nucleotidase
MLSTDQLREHLQLGLRAVAAAEEPILRYFRSQDIGLIHKGDGSPVTLADKAAEAAIRHVLRGERPSSTSSVKKKAVSTEVDAIAG